MPSKQAPQATRKCQQRQTLKDVAQAAQVSVATVSRLATGRVQVTPALAERVKQAASKLKVELKRRKSTRIIGFILSNREMLHPFHSRLLAGTSAYCQAEGYGILYLPIHYDAKGRWRDIQFPAVAFAKGFTEGFILTGRTSQNLFDVLTRGRLPFAVLGNNVVGEWHRTAYDTVWFDDVGGAHEATCYLRSLGHTNIWCVANCRLPWFSQRYQGYCRAMVESSLKPRLSDIDSDRDLDIGYLGMKSILQQREPVTAVFAPGDATAQGVCKALRDGGLQVPQDVSVIGFNDIEAGALDPPLTTIRVYIEQIGKKLADMVVMRSERPELAVQQYSFPTELVKRGSCRAIR
jgi:DNA-binding LacI/PurR family transcriptional regulator